MITLPALLKVLQRGGRTQEFLAKMFVPDFGFVPPDGAAAKGMLGIRAFLKEYESQQCVQFALDCVPYGTAESNRIVDDDNDVYEVLMEPPPLDKLDKASLAAATTFGGPDIKWRRFKHVKSFLELEQKDFKEMGPGRLMFVDSVFEHHNGGTLDLSGDSKYISWNNRPTDCAALLDFIAMYCDFCENYKDTKSQAGADLARKYRSAGKGLVVVFIGGTTQVRLQVWCGLLVIQCGRLLDLLSSCGTMAQAQPAQPTDLYRSSASRTKC